jgi:hypothetical protein
MLGRAEQSRLKRSAFVRSATASRQWIAASVSSAPLDQAGRKALFLRTYSRHVTLFESVSTPLRRTCARRWNEPAFGGPAGSCGLTVLLTA